MRFYTLTLLAVALVALGSHAEEKCEQDVNCMTGECQCFSTESPFAFLDPSFTPQFVVLSFDEAVTVTNFPFYEHISSTYKNSNGCRATMTFFVSHLYNDYTYVNELHRLGHEIAVLTVTHKPDISNYWKPANYSVWSSEAVDMRDMLKKYGNIPEDDIKGFQAPFLENGGDQMYQALFDNGFKYDSSWTALEYTNWYGREPLGAAFPYTLDFKSDQDCTVGRCPQARYPGFWVAPLLDLQDIDGNACALIDACSRNQTNCPEQECEDNVYDFLVRNFEYNYGSNRAPMGVFMHHSWFVEDEINESTAHTKGFTRFLDYIQTKDDVWIVSMDRVIEWMKQPYPAMNLDTHPAFQCPTFDPETTCPDMLECTYDGALPVDGVSEVRMNICTRPCPKNLPWLGNVNGD